MAAYCHRRARSFWGIRRRCNCCHFLSSSGDLAQKAASFRAACRPGLGPGKPQAEDAQSRVEPSSMSGEFCSKSAASNLLIYPASIWYSCVSTPGFWPPDRFSETSTLAYKFGEIAGVPRRQSQPAVRPGAPSAARPILLVAPVITRSRPAASVSLRSGSRISWRQRGAILLVAAAIDRRTVRFVGRSVRTRIKLVLIGRWNHAPLPAISERRQRRLR